MAVSYTCPNPDCGVAIKTPNRVQPGKTVKCPKCNKPFVPEPEEKSPDAGGVVFKMVDDPNDRKKPAAPMKPGGKKPEAPIPEPAKYESPAKKSMADDDEDDESIKKGYGVIKETEAELKEAEKHKPKFTEIQDKFKKSARGPAQALLVLPSQLLTAEGLITLIAGVLMFVVGMWPLVFNDAPPGDEEAEEAFQQMAIGIFAFVWGALICFGASEMHEIKSYTWAMVGSVMGVLPILVGIFGIIMLQNPKVKAGFEEGEAGPDEGDEDEDGEDEDDEDEDDEDEDDDEDDDDGPKKKKRKPSTREDDDDEDEDETPKKKKKRPKKMDDD